MQESELINIPVIGRRRLCLLLDAGIVTFCLAFFALWLADIVSFNTADAPVLSPLTCLSLVLMSGGRLAQRYLTAWPTPLTMAWLGIVIGGNSSSMMVQMMLPTLITDTFPRLIPTSIMTSFGLICFCIYELLVIMRKTPRQAFILDDILLHLALIPGAFSLLGHVSGNHFYISAAADPRIGISLIEMNLMAGYAAVALLSNPNLFLWRFLSRSRSNRLIFSMLFINQYVAPLVIVWASGRSGAQDLGLELFVLVGGVLATLSFLLLHSISMHAQPPMGGTSG